MAISRAKKEELVAQYKHLIENSETLVFTDYRGINVPEIQSLRTVLGGHQATYMIVKNSLFSIALEQAERPALAELLRGPNAIMFVGEDISTSVKALQDWIKDQDDVIEIKGGLMASSVLGVDQVDSLTDLPTRSETLSMILGALTAPSSKLVRTLHAPSEQLARVLKAPVSGLYNVLNARVQQLQEKA